MALIKCSECGQMVSDKASVCPNCGCPVESVDNSQSVNEASSKPHQPQKMKDKMWMWALLLLCLLGVGGYFAFGNHADAEEVNDKSADGKNAVVELTSEFIEAVRKYDGLGVFGEGMAAVQRNGKWGYINTKGEEVLPPLYDVAEAFSEGMAAVQRNGKWGYINTAGEEIIPLNIDAYYANSFSEGLAVILTDYYNFVVIDKKGDRLFGGKCGIGDYAEDLVASDDGIRLAYTQGKLYIPIYTESVSHIVYNAHGDKIEEIDSSTYYELEQQGSPKSNSYTEVVQENGDIENCFWRTCGLKDADGHELVPAIYDNIENPSVGGQVIVNNGVVLVKLIEYGDDVMFGYADMWESENMKVYYGYADLKGHDTFSQETKMRCQGSHERAAQILSRAYDNTNDNYYYDDYESSSASQEEVLSWLEGNWRYQMQMYGETLEMRVGISGGMIVVMTNGRDHYAGPYTIEYAHLVYNRHNGMSEYLIIDKVNQRLKADENNYMQRF